MGLLSLLRDHPLLFAALAALLLYSVVFHEIAHGLAAWAFGDDTARRRGRLSLNPLPHIDPLGTLMLFLAGFGWAKPVPVDYGRLGSSRAARVAVSLAGVAANILIAALAIFLAQLPIIRAFPSAVLLLTFVIRINIMLGAFNLIPIPPLDGSKALLAFLPESAQSFCARVERFGFLILIVLLYSGVLNPVVRAVERSIYRGISLAGVF